jgi:hypothetical protein
MIRALDSRLTDITYDASGTEPVLVYGFEVAGRREQFALAVTSERVTSIADLYPEAAARERELQKHFGLRFVPLDPEAGG